MEKDIYNFLIESELKEREEINKEMERFIKDWEDENFIGENYYKNISNKLEMILNQYKKMAQLEEMQNYLWNKVYK